MTRPSFDVNPSQQQAINHKASHLLIVAGPGTGKTHTLVLRIISTIPQLQSNQKILAITFTNKAAQEMRERLISHNPSFMDKVTIETFHSFCLKFLRQQKIEDEDFEIISPEEILTISESIWPKKTISQRNKLLQKVSLWKASDFSQSPPEYVQRYNSLLIKRKCIDFDDILLRFWALLSKHNDVKERFHDLYRYIFVDEYQDINKIQHAVLKLMVGEGCLLTAIGDPRQAIYGFRGSNANLFDAFQNDFLPTKVMSLDKNYRSSSNLLKASSQVIAKMADDSDPPLVAHIQKQGHLSVYEALTESSEAEYVVHSIEKIVGGTSMFSQDSKRVTTHEDGEFAFGDIAVLYRLNSQRHALKKAFERSGMPYQIYGKQSSEGYYDEIYQMRPEQVGGLAGDKVSLMTLHAAKGLEFSVVFIVGCENNLIPLHIENFESNVEEERRLFYVGMTRAKQSLILTKAKNRFVFGKKVSNVITPFIHDIEEQLERYQQKSSAPQKKKEEIQLTLFG